jgi:NADPH-dependent 7-cyano-7-deazaguanine reductase QueF
MNLQTHQRETFTAKLTEWHILPLPSCCPVSKNPQPGSYLMIAYQPQNSFLEVYSLHRFIQKFVGGYNDGQHHIREMETMIDTIAQTCADTLETPVVIGAYIILQHNDQMVVVSSASPKPNPILLLTDSKTP